MPLYNENGEEVAGAMTPEEVEAKLDVAKQEAEKAKATELASIQADLATAKQELADKATELEGLSKKDFNFKTLESAKKDLEKKIDDLQTQLTGVAATVNQKDLDLAISAMAGGDADLIAKIKLALSNFKPLAEEKDEKKKQESYTQRLAEAYTLATGHRPTDSVLRGAIVSSAGGYVPPAPGGTPGGKLSEGGKEVAGKLGIGEEELKKHSLI